MCLLAENEQRHSRIPGRIQRVPNTPKKIKPCRIRKQKLPRELRDADLFELNKEQYILVADIYTKFPILREIRSTYRHSIIHALKGILSENGIPRHLHTENGL